MINNGWPSFLHAKAMPDGKLAVALSHHKKIYVGIVSLNGLNVEPNPGSKLDMHGLQQVQVRLITIGSDFVVVPLDQFDKLSYHKLIPQYQNVPLLE